MTKAVFTTKLSPAYDDVPELRYHFPNQYLGRARQTLGDWIIYYEPRRTTTNDASRGGRQSYFAMARVFAVIPDDRREDHHYALMEGYQDFSATVPFRIEGEYFESALRRSDGKTNKGASGHSVRLIGDKEFEMIAAAGFATTTNRPLAQQTLQRGPGFEDIPQALFDRPIVDTMISRPFRDAAFTQVVRAAYKNTCAFTGLSLINGGGRPEVQAAHIQPVAHKGPDSIRNGMALSGTMHWLFDRGLISVKDDFRIVKADRLLGDDAHHLFRRSELIVPSDARYWPHPQFLRYHRENIFKG